MSSATVDHLLSQVTTLPPNELGEFASRLTEWRRAHDDEDALLTQIALRLPKDQELRLADLIKHSETAELSAKELREYRDLAQQAEQLQLARVQALARLARLRGVPLDAVMCEVDWESRADAS
ncbi:MAG: hypothetical protein ACI8W8_004476 [Rhodothermales bacterium]|jgi:hypothetical protein